MQYRDHAHPDLSGPAAAARSGPHLLELIEALRCVPGAESDLAAAAWELADRVQMHGGAKATVHCDVHLGNVLWHRSRVTGLVDFD